MLDYYGVALAGADDPLVAILLDELAEAGGAEQAGVIGHKARLPVLSAALVNGAIGHALDYDDVNLAMPGHPSVAILPALLALAEQRHSSGREVIAAFVAGYETACRIGMALRPGHYGLGFHATGTVGAFGAAAACAHLLGLDAAATAQALGIAGTQAAGLKSQFGTMCKPFHAGKAAQNGLLAARLAARGFSSRPDLVECEQGFALTHGPDFHPEKALAEPPGGFHILANLFKYHAACYMTHGPIECGPSRSRERHGVMPDDIAAITLAAASRIEPGLQHRGAERRARSQIQPAPDRGDGARRRRYGRARRLQRRHRDRPGAGRIARAGRVRFPRRPGRKPAPRSRCALRDGRVVRASHDAGIPSADIAAQGERLAAKFDALAGPVLGAARARELRERVLGLDRLADAGILARAAYQ